jgi:membrane fusion protein (multidrug efflux system)
MTNATQNETTQLAAKAAQDSQTIPARPTTRRKAMLVMLGAATAVAAAGYGFYYYSVARFHQDTDDAYVAATWSRSRRWLAAR